QARVRWYARFAISSARSAVGSDEWRLRGQLGGSDAGVAEPWWRRGQPAGVGR
ncbi:hypothetical protein BHE74_00013143, partial [Ensete ventricosum]